MIKWLILVFILISNPSLADEGKVNEAVDGYFDFNNSPLGLNSCNNGNIHEVLDNSRKYDPEWPTADRLCPALIVRVYEKEGIKGLLKGLQEPETTVSILAKAYMTKDVLVPNFQFELNGKAFKAPEEERAVLAGAIFAAQNLGKKRLGNSVPEFLKTFFIENFGGVPDIPKLKIPIVPNPNEQLTKCYKPKQSENKIACAIAGEMLILRFVEAKKTKINIDRTVSNAQKRLDDSNVRLAKSKKYFREFGSWDAGWKKLKLNYAITRNSKGYWIEYGKDCGANLIRFRLRLPANIPYRTENGTRVSYGNIRFGKGKLIAVRADHDLKQSSDDFLPAYLAVKNTRQTRDLIKKAAKIEFDFQGVARWRVPANGSAAAIEYADNLCRNIE